MKWIKVAGLVLAANALLGCGAKEPMTADKLIAAMKAANVPLQDVQKPQRDSKSPLPNSYKEHVTFALPSVAPKGGQFFVCDKKEYCDAIFVYFDALKAFAGPYVYRSQDGLVVAQLNSGLRPDEAEPIKAVIDSLK